MRNSYEARAQRGDVMSIYMEFLTGSPTCGDIWEWLDRAKAAGEPCSSESSLLLQELRSRLAVPGTDPAWREVGTHPVFRIQVHYLGSQNLELNNAVAATVTGVTVTAAVLPFMQSLATQAGQRAFEVARATTRRVISRYADEAPAIHRHRRVVIEETAAGLRFIVPPRLPDTALTALASTDLEALAAPDEANGTVSIYWDEETKEWRRHVSNG